MILAHDDGERGVSPLLALNSILGFWFFYMVIATLRAVIMEFDAQGEMLVRRIIVTIAGIVITWLLYLLIRRADHRSLPVRFAVAFSAAIPCAIAMAAANHYMFNIYDPHGLFDEMTTSKMEEYREKGVALKLGAEFALNIYYFLTAWASLYIALSYAGEMRRVERRAVRLEQAARQAELRSLRYQVNPHFLFNTLNSLSSLVLTRRNDEAEAMIMSLSNFYRTSLTGDPLDDVPLSEEVQLQKLYLDIEAVRFPERLKSVIDIPSALMDCCVPGLILQPLVENAIKYGVSRATRPVTITIRAREEDGMLHLSVCDDGDVLPGDGGAGPLRGNGIGLNNVRERLAARFGAQGSIAWQAPAQGGFIVRLAMPIVRQAC